MIILSKVLKESNQFKILAIKVAAKRTLDNALLLIRMPPYCHQKVFGINECVKVGLGELQKDAK